MFLSNIVLPMVLITVNSCDIQMNLYLLNSIIVYGFNNNNLSHKGKGSG